MAVDEWTPAETLEIRSLETLKVMAESRRAQIVDLLRRDSATVKQLAALMQAPPKSLYYHVNLLEQHGLIRVVGTRLVSGILEKRYRATAYLFDFEAIAFGPDVTPEQSALEGISSIFAITRDDLRIGLESGSIDLADEAPAAARLGLRWDLLNLSAGERDELDQRLRALFDGYSSENPAAADEQTYRCLFVMFPSYRAGERPTLPAPNTAPDELP